MSEEPLNATGVDVVVLEQELDPVTSGQGHAVVEVAHQAHVGGVDLEADAVVSPGPLTYHIDRRVRGTVVDHQDLEVGVGLATGAGQALVEVPFSVVSRYADADQGPGAQHVGERCQRYQVPTGWFSSSKSICRPGILASARLISSSIE